MKLSTYFAQLDSHDWFYGFSDSHSVWTRGDKAEKELAVVADRHTVADRMLKAFTKHHFSGDTWGTAKTAKPTLAECRSWAREWAGV